MISITENGKNLDITLVKVEKKVKSKDDSKPQEQTLNIVEVKRNLYKADMKNELRTMILNLVVRKVDYQRFEFNTAAEYRCKIMELIEMM